MLKVKLVLTNASEKFFRDFFKVRNNRITDRFLRCGKTSFRVENLDAHHRSMDLLVREDTLPDIRKLCRRITALYRMLKIDLVILQDEGGRYLTGHLLRYYRGGESAVNLCVTSRTSNLLDAYIALKQ